MRICHFCTPILDFTLIVSHVEVNPGAWIGPHELSHDCLQFDQGVRVVIVGPMVRERPPTKELFTRLKKTKC